MSRSIALGLALLVGALVTLALWFTRVERGSEAPSAIEGIDDGAREHADVLAPLNSRAVDAAVTEDSRSGVARTELSPEAPSISGVVVVEGGFPAVEAHVCTLMVEADGPRVPTLRARVASDGSFVLPLPRGAKRVILGLESALLFAESVVDARAGESGVVLRARLYAAVEGRIVPVSLPESWKAFDLTVKLSPIDLERLKEAENPLIGLHLVSSWGLAVDSTGSAEPSGTASFHPADDGSFRLGPLPTRVGLMLRVENPDGPAWLGRLDPLLPGEVRGVAVELRAGVTISGRVVDERGEGVERTYVGCESVAEAEGAQPPEGTRVATDTSGRFELAPLAPGRWRVSVEDYRFAQRAIEVVDATARDVGDLTLSVVRGGSIRGKATWPDGSSVASFEAWAISPDGMIERFGNGLYGSFAVDGLADGVYRIDLSARRGSRVGRASVDGVHPGDAPLQLVLTESPAFGISGSVVDEEGRGIHSALVMAGTEFDQTDRYGAFELLGLSEGEVQLNVQAPGRQAVDLRVIVGPRTEPLRIVLERAGWIRGKVVDGSGAPVANALVFDRAAPALVVGGEMRTDAEGRFSIEVKYGRARIMAAKSGYASSEVFEVDVTPGQRLDDVVLRLSVGCRVAGRVLDVRGNPVPDAEVNLEHLFLSSRGAKTDAQGCFVLDDLPAGTFEIRAAFLDDARGGVGATATVELHPDRPATVELRMPE